MKRPPEEEDLHPSSVANKLEKFLSGFWTRHPRFFLYAGMGLLILVIVLFIAVKISGNRP